MITKQADQRTTPASRDQENREVLMVNMNITILEEFERNRQAVMELGDFEYEVNSDYRRVTILEECSCLPDLPDGRSNGGRGGCCPACEAEKHDEEIPFGGE